VFVLQRAAACREGGVVCVATAQHPLLDRAEYLLLHAVEEVRERRFNEKMISGNLTCMKECEIRCASA
jgi:hypothetical protein